VPELDVPLSSFQFFCSCCCCLGTGTFVAIHTSLEKARRGEQVDIKNTVLHLRSQRMGMIQSKEQYMFVYAVVEDVLKEKEKRQRARPNRANSTAFFPSGSSLRSLDETESDEEGGSDKEVSPQNLKWLTFSVKTGRVERRRSIDFCNNKVDVKKPKRAHSNWMGKRNRDGSQPLPSVIEGVEVYGPADSSESEEAKEVKVKKQEKKVKEKPVEKKEKREKEERWKKEEKRKKEEVREKETKRGDEDSVEKKKKDLRSPRRNDIRSPRRNHREPIQVKEVGEKQEPVRVNTKKEATESEGKKTSKSKSPEIRHKKEHKKKDKGEKIEKDKHKKDKHKDKDKGKGEKHHYKERRASRDRKKDKKDKKNSHHQRIEEADGAIISRTRSGSVPSQKSIHKKGKEKDKGKGKDKSKHKKLKKKRISAPLILSQHQTLKKEKGTGRGRKKEKSSSNNNSPTPPQKSNQEQSGTRKKKRRKRSNHK